MNQNSFRLLEVCVDSYASAMAAIRGGADRLELCSALSVGGLTPWTELLSQIRAVSEIPIRCLMRPRPGDFLYSSEEIALLCAQIRALHRAGADGFVVGALCPDGSLDAQATRRLCDAADGAGLTLHRAIDVSRDPLQTYRDAAVLGIDTVLTSGAAANCLAGRQTLGRLLALRDAISGPEIPSWLLSYRRIACGPSVADKRKLVLKRHIDIIDSLFRRHHAKRNALHRLAEERRRLDLR